MKFARLVLVVVFMCTLLVVPAQAKQAAAAPHFSAELLSQCFGAYGLGDSWHVTGVLSNAAGKAVANYSGDADVTGGIYDACFSPADANSVIKPGYKMSFSVYDASSTLQGSYSIVVPNISITAYNLATGAVSGAGPKGKSLSVNWTHANLNATQTYSEGYKTVKVPATGLWSVNFATTKFRGGDPVHMWVTMNNNFAFERYFHLPYVSCGLKTNVCSVHGMPLQAVSVNIVHGGKTYKLAGKFNVAGVYTAKLVTATGSAILLVPGDKVTATGIAGTYVVAKLTAAADLTSSVISGKAPASRYFNVWVKNDTMYFPHWTGSNAAGNYSASFSDLSPEVPFTIIVDYIDKVSGNETTLSVDITG
jgi:hypothetical protein